MGSEMCIRDSFYLAYSQAGFASGYLDVSQLTFTREER